MTTAVMSDDEDGRQSPAHRLPAAYRVADAERRDRTPARPSMTAKERAEFDRIVEAQGFGEPSPEDLGPERC